MSIFDQDMILLINKCPFKRVLYESNIQIYTESELIVEVNRQKMISERLWLKLRNPTTTGRNKL